MCFRTPPYKDVNIEHDVKVCIELVRKSDNSRSDPKGFTYTPSTHQRIGAKRPRIDGSSASSSSFSVRSENSAVIPTTVANLSDILQKNSLNSVNLSEDLQVESEELENMYNYVFSEMDTGDVPFNPISNSIYATDGPTKRNNERFIKDKNKMFVFFIFKNFF